MADLPEDIEEIQGNLEEAHQPGENAEAVEGNNNHAVLDLFDYTLRKDTEDVVDLRISNCPVPDRMSRVPPPARANAGAFYGWGLVVKPINDDGSKDLWMVCCLNATCYRNNVKIKLGKGILSAKNEHTVEGKQSIKKSTTKVVLSSTYFVSFPFTFFNLCCTIILSTYMTTKFIPKIVLIICFHFFISTIFTHSFISRSFTWCRTTNNIFMMHSPSRLQKIYYFFFAISEVSTDSFVKIFFHRKSQLS
jgi:hypothetical protein